MTKERKSRAFNPRYESPSQGISLGFEHPFEWVLDPSNRWMVLSRLKQTKESWIAGIIPVLNLVKLAGAAVPCPIVKVWHNFSASIRALIDTILLCPL